MLVLAGAGTGKTRVLTTRIAHILNLGRARPAEILAVTFTNKAAREMKQRVGQMVGQIVEGMPWLGTFHSIGVKILRRHAELVGLKSNFTILDVDDQIRVIKQLLEAEKLDEKRWPARVFAIDPRRLEKPRPDARPGAGRRSRRLRQRQGQEALRRLSGAAEDAQRRRLRRSAAGDTSGCSAASPDVLRQYQQRFKFILVDEYQDTNVAQYLWLRLLAQTHSAVIPAAPKRGSAPSPQVGEGGERERAGVRG